MKGLNYPEISASASALFPFFSGNDHALTTKISLFSSPGGIGGANASSATFTSARAVHLSASAGYFNALSASSVSFTDLQVTSASASALNVGNLTFSTASGVYITGSTAEFDVLYASDEFKTPQTTHLPVNLGGTSKNAIAWKYGCLLTKSSFQQTPNAVWEAVNWDQEEYDDGAFHSTSTNNTRITPGFAGFGEFVFGLFMGSTLTGERSIRVTKNGATMPGCSRITINNDSFSPCAFVATPVLEFDADDYFEAEVIQNSGGSAAVIQSDDNTFFSFQVVER